MGPVPVWQNDDDRIQIRRFMNSTSERMVKPCTEEGVNMQNRADGAAGLAPGYRYRLRRAFTCFCLCWFSWSCKAYKLLLNFGYSNFYLGVSCTCPLSLHLPITLQREVIRPCASNTCCYVIATYSNTL